VYFLREIEIIRETIMRIRVILHVRGVGV
jgi:hypothetical protein